MQRLLLLVGAFMILGALSLAKGMLAPRPSAAAALKTAAIAAQHTPAQQALQIPAVLVSSPAHSFTAEFYPAPERQPKAPAARQVRAR